MAFLYVFGNFCILMCIKTKNFAFLAFVICMFYTCFCFPLSQLVFLAATAFFDSDCGFSGHPEKCS